MSRIGSQREGFRIRVIIETGASVNTITEDLQLSQTGNRHRLFGRSAHCEQEALHVYAIAEDLELGLAGSHFCCRAGGVVDGESA